MELLLRLVLNFVRFYENRVISTLDKSFPFGKDPHLVLVYIHLIICSVVLLAAVVVNMMVAPSRT